jgi:hypothetical protein
LTAVYEFQLAGEGGDPPETYVRIGGYDFATRANFLIQFDGSIELNTADGTRIDGVAWPEDLTTGFERQRFPGPIDDSSATGWLPWVLARDVLSRPSDYEAKVTPTSEGGVIVELSLPGGMRHASRDFGGLEPVSQRVRFEVGEDGRVVWLERSPPGGGTPNRTEFEYSPDDPTGVGVVQRDANGFVLREIRWDPDGDPSLFTPRGVVELAMSEGLEPEGIRRTISAEEIASTPPGVAADLQHFDEGGAAKDAERARSFNIPLVGVGAVMLAAGLFTIIRRRMT